MADEPADLVKLRAAYEAEMKAATAPIRVRQIEKLQALLKTFTQRGELENAVAVRGELEKLQSTTGPTEGKTGVDATTAFRAAIAESTWQWERAGRPASRITFHANGTFTNPNWKGDFRWRISGERTLTLEGDTTGTTKMTFDPSFSTFEGPDFKTGDPIKGRRVAKSTSPASSGTPSGAFGEAR
ncbi:hypothetical protein ACFQ5Q_20225 [Luteolibacter ambystomatis]